MIKVAIAGTNGLAQYIANFIATQTYHQFIILSRNERLTNKGWQVLQTDYNTASDLQFKLAGVDTVISTVSGDAQLNLIDAAAAAHVRRFVPSEFEGSPSVRPANDVLDNRRRAALARLQQYEAQGMRYTVFTCGIFYERFAPGGMAASQIGLRSNIGQEGEYIMDMRRGKAQLPFYNEAGQPVYVCMTSARDVARMVVAALSLASWPREFRMRGDRMSVSDLVTVGEQLRGKCPSFMACCDRRRLTGVRAPGRPFERSSYTTESLQDVLTYARAVGDTTRERRIVHLIVTAEGRYDFGNVNLDSITPQRFREWLAHAWASTP